MGAHKKKTQPQNVRPAQAVNKASIALVTGKTILERYYSEYHQYLDNEDYVTFSV